MPETIIDIAISDPDITSTSVRYYSPAPDDSVWIKQKENGDASPGSTVMLNRNEAKQVRDALDRYLNSLNG